MDDAGRLKVQLQALTHSPQGHVDDTRFEKLLDRLSPYVSEANKIQLFVDNGGLEALEKGLALDDARVVSVAIRLVGILVAHSPASSSPSSLAHVKLLDTLLDTQNISINADALVRNACLHGLSTAAQSNVALDWMTSPERCNRLVSFMFRSFSDSSVFVARAATQLLCELITKGLQTEQRLIDSGLKRHIEISMSEVPKPSDLNSFTSPPPLHHNKICLIDLAISFHQRAPTNSYLDISLSSLLGLLMDSDRHVRSRMVEAVQLIGLDNAQSQIEDELFGVTNKLMSSGEGDLILTAIELIGVLRGIPDGSIRKFFGLVLGIVVPVFSKVISIHADNIPKTLPVKVDLPQSTLLQSVLECLKNLVGNGYTSVVPGSLVVDLVVYGLSGGDRPNTMVYVRECHPAYELAALLLARSHVLIHEAQWMLHHDTQRLLQALLAALARSWSAFSVKTVVSLLGNGKMEGRIFKEFGQQLRDSIVKGFASEESESREHVVAFIGTLYKEDVSQTAIEYYIASVLHSMVVTGLEDTDSAVRTAALDSLKFLCAEVQTWQLLVNVSPESINSLVSNFVPPGGPAQGGVAEPSFLKKVVHLLYDEDPYVQRASIALLASWTANSHTKLALLFLIWDPASGLLEGINHALHRSDWDAQVQSIQLLRSICLTLGMLSFLAVNGNLLVLEMIKNCEERISQKEACSTLIAIRELMNTHQAHNLLPLLSPPLSPFHGQIRSREYFNKELQTFYTQVNAIELDSMLQGLSDEHLYDEDEEEDLVLRYQDIKADDDLDCD